MVVNLHVPHFEPKNLECYRTNVIVLGFLVVPSVELPMTHPALCLLPCLLHNTQWQLYNTFSCKRTKTLQIKTIQNSLFELERLPIHYAEPLNQS